MKTFSEEARADDLKVETKEFFEDARKRLEAKIQSGNFEMVRRYHICSLRRKNETPFHEIIRTFLFFGPRAGKSRDNTFFSAHGPEKKYSREAN